MEGRGTFVSSSVMSRRVQMAGTNGGHSVDVLSSRPELITGSTRSAGAACGPSPQQGQTQRPNALDSSQSRRPRRPEPPGRSRGRGFCVCCLDLSQAKKVPSPSMKMYLTVGELREGFAACLRRGRPFPFELGCTGKPTRATRKSASGHSLDNLHILLGGGLYLRRGGRSWGKVLGAGPGCHGRVFCLWVEYRGLSPSWQTKDSTASILGVSLSVAMAFISPLLLKDQVGHPSFSSLLS